MCGITGFIDFSVKTSGETLKKMISVLTHRGPDDCGLSFFSSDHFSVGLAHQRLSILDLSNKGNQPMHYLNLTIVYNGEIYNFREIRKELISYNYTFFSDCDTEVILKAFHKWGIDCIKKLNGMFAFSIFDREANKLFIARDRCGVKPCFYYKRENLFLFSSELKSFHKHPRFEKRINTNSLGLYLQYGYVPEPFTIFENTYKVKAGTYLQIDLLRNHITEEQYWNVSAFYEKPRLNIDSLEASEELENLMQSSFDYRMVSDVPVGVFLSGGYDSSLVTALLQKESTKKLNTFTIGFSETNYNEANFANAVSKHLGTNHSEYYCSQQDVLNILPGLSEIYDEPFADSSSIPTILVSKLAKESVSVSLSADGGDELFGGYSKYTKCLNYRDDILSYPLLLRKSLASIMGLIDPNRIPFLKSYYNFDTKYAKFRNILNSSDISTILKFTSQHFTDFQVNNLLNNDYISPSTYFDSNGSQIEGDLSKMMSIDFKTYMVDDILTKVDRATMSVSLEGREPLLDYRLVEFAAQLPCHLKIKNGNKKILIKEIVHKYLPKEIMDRPKKGFGMPVGKWLKTDLKPRVLEYVNEEKLKEHDLLDVKEVIRIRDRVLNGEKESAVKLWYIFIFQMWYQRWI